MKTRLPPVPAPLAELPVAALPEGPICPPLEPDHPTWTALDPWDDPLASRGGYTVPSRKARETHDGLPCVTWLEKERNDRAFITGEPAWRDYAVACRVQPLQAETGPTNDEPEGARARAGVVFRQETVRRYYTFCLEGRKRLVLYRRNDGEWTELAGRDVEPGDGILTLRVELDADAIRAGCPELGVTLEASDTLFPAGLAGFRALGACRLFGLRIEATPGQRAENARRAAALAARTARLAGALPEEVEAGAIELRGRSLDLCADFHTPGRNDLLFSSKEGVFAETFEGRPLWQIQERMGEFLLAAESPAGRRILYALAGKRAAGTGRGINVTGTPMDTWVQDELLAVDGATGAVLRRVKLPVSPREDMIRYYDLSCEAGRLAGPAPTAFIVREWRQDWGGGGEMLWAYDAALNPLWERKVHPGYGHHNAVHIADVDGDGRDEVLAGGNLLSAAGEPLWRHDQADAFFPAFGGQHYDAALAGPFAGDPELDPVAFLIGGSSGVYVVDGLTGRTRARHRVGHAQWALPCKVRADLPGTQVMVGTRWDNYGILTLFSGRGDRLWSIQPDYVLQGSCPVQWTAEGPQHIWCNRSAAAMGLYDGFGRLALPLAKIRKLYGTGTKKPTQALSRTPGGRALLGFQSGDTLRLFGPGKE